MGGGGLVGFYMFLIFNCFFCKSLDIFGFFCWIFVGNVVFVGSSRTLGIFLWLFLGIFEYSVLLMVLFFFFFNVFFL